MESVAIILWSRGKLQGGGGAERQFGSFFSNYQQFPDRKFDLYLVLFDSLKTELLKAKILTTEKNLIVIDGGINWLPNSINALLLGFKIIYAAYRNKFRIWHLVLPAEPYLPWLWLVSIFSKRTLLTLNIVDCTVAHYYRLPGYRNDPYVRSYRPFLSFIKFRGIFSWYKIFVDRVKDGTIPVRGQPYVAAAKYCFPPRISLHSMSEKENVIIWAARMAALKHPLLFVDAIKWLKDYASGKISGWKIQMFGKGELLPLVEEKIREYKLTGMIQLGSSYDMMPYFSMSKLFVSTQHYENFTSLSMLEAMLKGNAIVARNVGQTGEFVVDGINGFLAKEDSASGIAQAILQYIEHPELHEQMRKASIRLATQVHNIQNFTADIENFWLNVLAQSKR